MRTRNFFTSIRYALHGIVYVFRNEQNFRMQVVVSVLVLFASWVFSLSASERVGIVLLIVFILVLELVNSAIEKFTDIVKPRMHEQVGLVKDIMAGTVLLSSVGAVLLGCMIFIPHVIELFAR